MARKSKAETATVNGNEDGIVETKADKFRRLANKRLLKAEKALASIANLGNTATYEYTEEQKDIVLRVINLACKCILDSFNTGNASDGNERTYL